MTHPLSYVARIVLCMMIVIAIIAYIRAVREPAEYEKPVLFKEVWDK